MVISLNPDQNIEDTLGLPIRVRTGILSFLFLNQNMCCGYSKEPPQ